MHNYIVPNRYKFITRIGNWSEEWEQEEVKMKDYMKNKSISQLASTIRDQKQTFSLRQASLSLPEKDGYLHFGQHIMLYNDKTTGFLAIDIQEKIKTEEEAYAITTTNLVQYPSVRTVFVVQRYEKEANNFKDDIVRYGQKIRIVANPRISNQKTVKQIKYEFPQFFLHSLLISPQRCAKISRRQEVCASSNDVFNTVWSIQHADPKIRFEMDKQPVSVDDFVLIQHCFTSSQLASDDILYQNDFGKEKEVFCHSFQCLNKTLNLIAEKEGRTTVEKPMRNNQPQNFWRFVLAQNPTDNFDETNLDQKN